MYLGMINSDKLSFSAAAAAVRMPGILQFEPDIAFEYWKMLNNVLKRVLRSLIHQSRDRASANTGFEHNR